MTFREAFRRNIGGLTRFSGREPLGSFWMYVAIVIAGTAVSGGIGMAVVLIPLFGRMQAFARAHPDQATVTQGPGSYSIQIEGSHPEFMPPFGPMLIGWGIIVALALVLLAAAVTRRLHDRGLRGGWAVIPLPFLVAGLIGMSHFAGAFGGSTEPPLGSFLLLFFNNLVYLAMLGIVVVMLVKEGDQGPNRFGPAPVES